MTKRSNGEDGPRSQEHDGEAVEARKRSVCYCADSASKECGSVQEWSEGACAPHTPRAQEQEQETKQVEPAQQEAKPTQLLEYCYCSRTNLAECGTIGKDRATNFPRHRPHKQSEIVPDEQRTKCVLFMSINEDAMVDSVYVPLDKFNAEELAYLRRVAANANSSLVTTCWANRSAENARMFAFGVRLDFESTLEDPQPKPDLREAYVKQPYALATLIIAGHNYE